MLGPIGGAPGASTAPDAKAAEKEKLRAACKDFEAVMLGIVFKQMSESVGGDGLDKGAANETWRGMLNDERAKHMAASGGLGLADALYRDMVGRV